MRLMPDGSLPQQNEQPPIAESAPLKVASEIPCLRARSAVFAPASCSRRTAMICSSMNLPGLTVNESLPGPCRPLRRQCPSNKTSGSAKRKNGTICQSDNKLALTEAELRLPVCRGLGMHDRPNSESARAQYRRLAQRCLLMVPTIQDQEGRTALLDMARV